ncbi:NAD(P)H-dependent flavin oxidoreductase [Novosphingobium pentaromativorans]|uniref:2-nitropropane dioxygenase n=2 Tax=Novosphingobium pentaromativorans TaxID=205844 RepID=G6E7W7_9SPHN|nr:nitronate monooxygenase [Novosphingobium pentaromativorans]EHJ62610.1 2-nitropropane dioxygenase [Novosphingobium pentaromativorans US6-1]
MFLVSGPEMVAEACKAGIVGALPRANARELGQFDAWLMQIADARARHADQHPGARIGPIAVNLATNLSRDELRENLAVCKRHGVQIIISAVGDPTELTKEVHDWGGVIFHDVTALRFAEKAIGAGVDGLTCIGAGGGGHSGLISHLALVPKVRSMFDGVVLMAGAIGNGAAIRAAEVLGADLAYMGTRFIATREAPVHSSYKQMLVDEACAGLMYTPAISGIPANWMKASMEANGLDPAALPVPEKGAKPYAHLPQGVKPWKTLWSAGQGIELIRDVPNVSELVARLRREYVAACETPSLIDAARLVDEVQSLTE